MHDHCQTTSGPLVQLFAPNMRPHQQLLDCKPKTYALALIDGSCMGGQTLMQCKHILRSHISYGDSNISMRMSCKGS